MYILIASGCISLYCLRVYIPLLPQGVYPFIASGCISPLLPQGVYPYCLRVNFIYQLKQRNIFLTVGDDEDLNPLIRVWNFDKRTKEGFPTLARTIRANVPNSKQPCSSVSLPTLSEPTFPIANSHAHL